MPRFLRWLLLSLAAMPLLATAAVELRMAEGDAETIKVELTGSAPGCPASSANQPLNSEVDESASYLKAARMGAGIYVHLPYFLPQECRDAVFDIRARHILWNGRWLTGSVRIAVADARDKSIFFTNEAVPFIHAGTYFDAAIPGATRARLAADFARITQYYQAVLKADPMQGVGSVVAIVRNKGNYFGFGGDALNIIRMSFDNPSAAHLDTLDQIFPPIYAHELAHKLQNDRLFALPLARHIVEGSADFIRTLVMHSAGLLDREQTRLRVMKAASDCAAKTDARTLRQKAAQNAVSFREPYDCGMVYYTAAFYTSGMSAADFVAVLRKALSGETNYADARHTLCLHFEADCRNERLNALVAGKDSYLTQLAWLEAQLAAPPLQLRAR